MDQKTFGEKKKLGLTSLNGLEDFSEKKKGYYSTRRHLYEMKKMGRNRQEDIWGEKKTWFNIIQLTRRLL